MRHWIDPVTGEYYPGDRAAPWHMAVPVRPSVAHAWDGVSWALSVAAGEPVIAAARYEREVAGIVWQGYGIATDRESQDKVDKEDRAVDKGMRADGKGWKCFDLSAGQVVFRPTSNAELQAIAAAVYDYVSACFAREAALLAAIKDGTFHDGMLAEGWPERGA